MAKCEICDKSINFGNKLSITRSHISKRTTRTWKPNLRTVKTIVDGQPKKVKVCAKCLRSGKIQKSIKKIGYIKNLFLCFLYFT